jgi:mitotic spindle assembly checkpoint protein MAD2B
MPKRFYTGYEILISSGSGTQGMDRSKQSLPQEIVIRTLTEFLEVAINFVVYVRGVYPAEAFERRRYLNIPVQWARHPRLRDYIHSTVATLQTFIQKDIVERVAVIFSDKNQVPIEKFVFRLKVNQSYKLDFPENDLEYALRAFLIKLSASKSMLQPLPDDCTWEILGYFKQLPGDASDKGQFWLPTDTKHWQQPPLITPIKSMSSEPLNVQLYLEHPSESDRKL